jgi:hypothetical protein
LIHFEVGLHNSLLGGVENVFDDGTYSSATIRCASAKKLYVTIDQDDWQGDNKKQRFSCGWLLKTGKLYSLRRIIIHKETGWMIQQYGNDLLGPKVLNSSTKPGQERKFWTVCVHSVFHNVLAVCL